MRIDREKPKQYVPYLIAFALGCIIGWTAKSILHTCPNISQQPTETIQYVDRIKTEIAYVPKETYIYKDGTHGTEKTDVDVNVPKQNLNIKVNGKEMSINKGTNEKYLFEKNKLALTQETSATLDVKIPTIDNTRRWEIGIGGSNNGISGMIGYPIKSNIGGWVAGDKNTIMTGISIKF